MKFRQVANALIGIVIAALVGYVIGVILEHPPGPGGLQFLVALLGAMIAIDVLVLGEALKPEKRKNLELQESI
jgi:uncharacterized membrane protein YeaQ/YmgE (transglycosylase-associated protein family)